MVQELLPPTIVVTTRLTRKNLAALIPLFLFAACGDSGDGGALPDGNTAFDVDSAVSTSVPTVVSNMPMDGATAVANNADVSITFSEAMDPFSLSGTTFSVTTGTPAVAIAGSIAYSDSVAVFAPNIPFESEVLLTATITTGAKSSSGVALAQEYSWSFTSAFAVAPKQPVDLGTAGDFVILAQSAITSTTPCVITGDVGISPATAAAITGFALTADVTNTFWTSEQVTGRVYAADNMPPTPAKMTMAVADMQSAFADAAAREPGATEVGGGSIGGQVLAPGVYKWNTGVLIPTDLTLSGTAADVWIFQIALGLTVKSGATIVLAGGAVPENIFWQVSGAVVLESSAHLKGIVLSQTAVTLETGATHSGRLLAQTAVTITNSSITHPEP